MDLRIVSILRQPACIFPVYNPRQFTLIDENVSHVYVAMCEVDTMNYGKGQLRSLMLALGDFRQETFVELSLSLELEVISSSGIVKPEVEATFTMNTANGPLWTKGIGYGTHLPKTSPKILDQLNDLRITRTVESRPQ